MKRRSAAVVTTGSGVMAAVCFGAGIVTLVELSQGACPCILIATMCFGAWGIVALGITSTCGVYWYKMAHAFDKYNAFLKTSWNQGKMTLKPGEEREEIIFVNKQDILNPYQVQVTSAGQATRTYDMCLEKTRV